MDESLLAGFELDLCADGKDIDHLAQDNIADLDIPNDIVNDALCLQKRSVKNLMLYPFCP